MSDRITPEGYLQVIDLEVEPNRTLMTDPGKCGFEYYHDTLRDTDQEGIRMCCGKCGLKLVIDTENAFDIAASLEEKDKFPDGSCLPGLKLMMRQSMTDGPEASL